jgi:2-hydroxychromene-2-carboxylate isomerase
MTQVDGIADAPLVVALDVRVPQAYLALHPAARFAEDLGITVDWLPLPAATLKPPPPPSVGDDRGVRHRRHRSRAIAREIAVYAEAQGLVLRELHRDADADALNLGWLWLREWHRDRLIDFLAGAFRAYWAVELDASDLDAVAGLVAGQGLDAEAFRTWAHAEGPLLAARIEAALHERGVFAVPSYLVEDEIFLGRQHLPMIRWILEGRRGPVPI